ncbi:putative secreted effector [Caenorhabditis elegans]|uniref:Candidate secreted effector n=1 Tax=Caenorhabditis elegans TaxID=6239 RepID=Q4R147_CAEEL|nr:putative secreted effector [Caenorhabditis elegans]CCD72103.1 Candidate secreted effector [Caenorhabditis elegans]|eukprot:NP_001033491.1 Uncharacterized protein CELE_F59A7.11 [Caenorhabditis elegans]
MNILINSLLFTIAILAVVWGYPGQQADHVEDLTKNRNEPRARRDLGTETVRADGSAAYNAENAGGKAWEPAIQIGQPGVNAVENAGTAVRNGAENADRGVETTV